MPSTPNQAIPFPTMSDGPSIPTHIQALADRVDTLVTEVKTSVAPAATVAVTPASGYVAADPVPVVQFVGGMVVCGGKIKPTSGNFATGSVLTIATIPVGYRPAFQRDVQAAGPSAAADARMYVTAAGAVTLVTGASAIGYISIDGLIWPKA